MAGIAGHRLTSASTAMRLTENMLSPDTSTSVNAALLNASGTDRPMSSSVTRQPARTLAARVTR